MDRYGSDVLASFKKRTVADLPVLVAELGQVLEDPTSRFVGEVVALGPQTMTLVDRHGLSRQFPWESAQMSFEGRLVRVQRPAPATSAAAPRRTASGSVAVDGVRARVARASRVYVEGKHDAELVERVWGDDLRVEGVVVEPLDGIDDLPAVVRSFQPGPGRRLGVLVDHLVAGSKESRIVAEVAHPHVLVTGHPYVDIWQAVKPAALGIEAWPVVPPGQPWKEGVCAALGVREPYEMWRRVLASVSDYTDLETPLLGAVERLIDFVTAEGG